MPKDKCLAYNTQKSKWDSTLSSCVSPLFLHSCLPQVFTWGPAKPCAALPYTVGSKTLIKGGAEGRQWEEERVAGVSCSPTMFSPTPPSSFQDFKSLTVWGIITLKAPPLCSARVMNAPDMCKHT